MNSSSVTNQNQENVALSSPNDNLPNIKQEKDDIVTIKDSSANPSQ